VPAVKEVQFFGAREFIEGLREMGLKVPTTAVRKGLYRGAVIIRDEARRRAPVRYGALKKSIVAVTKRIKSGKGLDYIGIVRIADVKYVVSATKTGKLKLKRLNKNGRITVNGVTFKPSAARIFPRKYAHLAEFGTRPHSTAPKNLSKAKGAKGRRVPRLHPGAKAKPFMRPAYDTKIGSAFTAFKEEVVSELGRIAVKTAARQARKKI
jgi:HK97 gp10 family phage protein